MYINSLQFTVYCIQWIVDCKLYSSLFNPFMPNFLFAFFVKEGGDFLFTEFILYRQNILRFYLFSPALSSNLPSFSIIFATILDFVKTLKDNQVELGNGSPALLGRVPLLPKKAREPFPRKQSVYHWGIRVPYAAVTTECSFYTARILIVVDFVPTLRTVSDACPVPPPQM